jgi:hypothetical protein
VSADGIILSGKQTEGAHDETQKRSHGSVRMAASLGSSDPFGPQRLLARRSPLRYPGQRCMGAKVCGSHPRKRLRVFVICKKSWSQVGFGFPYPQ